MHAKRFITFTAASLLGSTAPAFAVDFGWIGNNGLWSEASNWSGPNGQVPNNVTHAATVSANKEVSVDMVVALGELNVIEGAGVYTMNHHLFVDGTTTVDGSTSTLSVRDTPALRDVDTNELFLEDGGMLLMVGGTAQVDGIYHSQANSGALGIGTIEMDGPNNLDVGEGYLWAYSTNSIPTKDLVIRRSNDSSAKLDWTDPDAGIIVWTDSVLDIRMPFAGAFSGDMSIYDTLVSQHGITTLANADIVLYGGEYNANEAATITAPWLDLDGTISVTHDAVIEADAAWLRGTVDITGDPFNLAWFIIDAELAVLDSMTVQGTDDNTIIRIFGDTLTVLGGNTFINGNDNSGFDLDGQSSNLVTNIAADSGLFLNVEHIDANNDVTYTGTLNLDGTLFVAPHPDQPTWANDGTINIDGGLLSGRDISNTDTITGNGSIDPMIVNAGLLEADGGTLYLQSGAQLDGPDGDGTVHAITGDLVDLGGQSHNFSGTMVIGDGEGQVREIFETNNAFILGDNAPAFGSLVLNDGRLRADDVDIWADVTVTGTSLLRASGADPADDVRFLPTSLTTVIGTLEVEGDAVIHAGANFNGEGTIAGTSTIDTIDLGDQADLSDVSLATVGTLTINDDLNSTGTAQVAGLELAPTSNVFIDLGGHTPGSQFDVLDVYDNAALDGTLVLGTRNGFAPQIGDSFVVMNAGFVDGIFSSIDTTGLGADAHVTYTDDAVIVEIVCLGDVNKDCTVNTVDLLMLLAAWGSCGNCDADLNSDGFVDIIDMLALLAAWGPCDCG